MAYLKANGFSGTESCVKCGKPMDDPKSPAIIIKSFTKEQGREEIWAHIKCIEMVIGNVKRRAALRKRDEVNQ